MPPTLNAATMPQEARMENVEGMAGAAAVGGIVGWVVQRVMNGPDKAADDNAALRKEAAALATRVATMEQQISGQQYGLIHVVGRLAEVVERLDRSVTHLESRMENAE